MNGYGQLYRPCSEDDLQYFLLPFGGDSLFPVLKGLCPKDCQDQDLLELSVIAYKTNKKILPENKKERVIW